MKFNHGGKRLNAGRKPKEYETERLTFQVPKEIKPELYKKLKPIVREEIQAFEGDVSGGTDKCTKCPECGCEKFLNKNELGNGFRNCKDCGQEWWTDIDYTNP